MNQVISSYERSSDIAELAKSLAQAQSKMLRASKESENPHFKSKFANLSSVWNACQEPLTAAGLSIIQIPETDGPKVRVTTVMMHTSGQWISGCLTMTAEKSTPQSVGSCITYARRYALMAFVGVAADDDDGHEASVGNSGKNKQPKPHLPEPEPQPLPEPPPHHVMTHKALIFDKSNKDSVEKIKAKLPDNLKSRADWFAEQLHGKEIKSGMITELIAKATAASSSL